MKPVLTEAVVVNIVFNHRLIAGHDLSLIDRKYINPIKNNKDLDFLILDNNLKWSKAIIIKLIEIYHAYEKDDFGYELKIKNILSSLWLILASNLIPKLQSTSKTNTYRDERIKAMLEFIHKNFSNNISLDHIADSVHISKSECCRYFKKYLKTSPIKFLMQYRIREASVLLENTSKTITEILNLVGFNDPSYFTRTFKRFTSYTPSQYRKVFK